MKVTIQFADSDVAPALQNHLDGGVAVRTYIVAAVRYFNTMLDVERRGSMCGFGDKSRFSSYNKEVSPGAALREAAENA